jgi:hypothetical protein
MPLEVVPMPAVNRTWRPVETRLLAEYLAARWPGHRVQQRVRVGRLHPSLEIPGLSPEEQQALGCWRRWVDAIVWDPPRVILMEAAVKPDPGDVSQLELYLHLFPTTPEFQEWAAAPLVGVLVYAVDDPTIHRLARGRGLLVDVFSPSWIVGYLQSLAPRARRAPLTAY